MATETVSVSNEPSAPKAPVETKPEEIKTEAKRELEKKEYVRYFPPYGFASREISEAAWINVGADDQKAISWDASNDFRVAIDKFSDAALAYIESDKDDGLEIVEE